MQEHSQEASQAAGGISSGLGLKSRQPHDPDPKRRKEEVLVSCEDVLSANGKQTTDIGITGKAPSLSSYHA